jgi:MFS family permease
VAQLGGLEHYTLLPLAIILGSTVVVPVAGKLSDLYGRRPLYLGGLSVFRARRVPVGSRHGHLMVVGARFVQRIGVGTMMLSAALLIAALPRFRQPS